MKNQVIIIRVDQKLKDKLIEKAKKEDRTLSEYLRITLKKIIKEPQE